MKIGTLLAFVLNGTTDLVRACDIFPTQIKLNYKGKDSFKTFFGGLITVGIFAVMVVYTVFLTNQVMNKRGSNTTLSTKITDLRFNPEVHYPGNGTFKFAVGYGDASRALFYNESYFRIEMFQGNNTRVGLTTQTVYEPLETTL